MHLGRLCLRDFRNYEGAELSLSASVNIFSGNNAQGKTNLLEAVYLLAIGRSFRTANEHELARYGCSAFKLIGEFAASDGAILRIDYGAGVDGKQILQNGMPLRRAQDLFGRVRVVIFSPDDLQLLKSGPEHRRTYLDLYLAQVDPRYRQAWYGFQRLLAQRNSQLRRIRDGQDGRDQLSVWNEALIDKASELASKRIAALAALGPLTADYHQRLAGGAESITLAYLLGGKILHSPEMQLQEFYRRELAAREQEEIARGLSLVGPQRDDISIGFTSGHDLRSFGSQGQQRTAALAMKLAAVDFLQSGTGESPIILLDDVLSEFDDARKQSLLSLLLETNQTLITTTDRAEFGTAGGNYRSFKVEAGRVSEDER